MTIFNKAAFVALTAMLGVSGHAFAEVEPGTVLSAANIDDIYNETFEGHKIKDLLTEKLEWRIREQGYEMQLVNSQPVKLADEWYERSEQNVGNVTINREEGRIDGWVGGARFPNIDMKDRDAAEKVGWKW